MTAVIGILNKEGAAIAADSAVTMTRGRREKISNSADKMVRLSDVQPISVMIFSNADFMAMPWDLIVRWYRHQRGKMEFPTLKDHANDFLDFLVRERFFCTDEQNKEYILDVFDTFFRRLDNDLPYLEDEDDQETMDRVVGQYREAFERKAEECRKKGVCPQFEDYTLESFREKWKDALYDYLEKHLTDRLVPVIRDVIVDSFYHFVIHRNDINTGLVFTGYGKEDKYPASLCVRVVLGFDGRLACFVRPGDDVTISEDRPFAVLPYAQTDVMMTLVKGVDPNLDSELCEAAEGAMKSMISRASTIMWDPCNQEISEVMGDIPYEDLLEEFKRNIHAKADKVRNRLVFSGVGKLPVRDMARLAEEMVSITAVKRHINFDDEGVGGLVDLAVITRDKGFTWLNRKGWYDVLGEDGFKI